MPERPFATVVIATYNRARWLDDTLRSLMRMDCRYPWDIVVIDNNSTDETPLVISKYASAGAVPVLPLFEPRQGKSTALNTALAHARGEIIAFTDDDVDVEAHWLTAACDLLDANPAADYVGGPVIPIWGKTPPNWFDTQRGDLWGTVAILDYGPEPFVFEERQKVPLGVNMAVRRRLIEQIGGFHPQLGRCGRSLLGQEQAEFFSRARATGARGIYVPSMALRHYVPAERLTFQYFWRWWFWKGVSRARVDAMHEQTELGLDLRTVPHVARVPRYVWGQLPRDAARCAAAALAGNVHTTMRHAMRICYGAGYIRECWTPRPADASPPAVPKLSPTPLDARVVP
jgi:glycosyltransferase involved in cell wall biosynthesis